MWDLPPLGLPNTNPVNSPTYSIHTTHLKRKHIFPTDSLLFTLSAVPPGSGSVSVRWPAPD